MTTYADTSALMKLLLEEEGTGDMVALQERGEPLVTAVVGYVEMRAALASAGRSGRIASGDYSVAQGELEALWGNLTVIPATETLVRRAGELAEQLALRGYDALHLAALQATGEPDEVTLACWDIEVARAGRKLGYHVVPAQGTAL